MKKLNLYYYSKPGSWHFFLISIILILASWNMDLSATDYFVKTAGNNTNPGTNWTTAWQTITYAGSYVSAGDVVYVSNGTYNEEITIASNGTAGNDISFISYNPGQAVINGNTYCFNLVRKTNILIQDFSIYSATSGFYLENAYNISITRNKIYNITSVGIYLNSANNTIIRSNLIYNNGYGIYFTGTCISNYSILNSIFNINNYGMMIQGSIKYVLILSNQFYSQSVAMSINISAVPAYIKIARNLIRDISNDGILISNLGGGQAYVYNNTICRNQNDGIKTGISGVVAFNNIILSNKNYGIEVTGGKSLYGANNDFYGNTNGPTNNAKFYWTSTNIFRDPMLDTVSSYTITSPNSAAVDTGKIFSGISDWYNEAAPDIGWKESPFAIPSTEEPPPSSPSDDGTGYYEEVRVFPTLITADIDELIIGFKNSENGDVNIHILNESGKCVWQKKLYLEQGMQEVIWKPTKDLGTGIYLVYIKDARGTRRKNRFLIIK